MYGNADIKVIFVGLIFLIKSGTVPSQKTTKQKKRKKK